MVITVAGVRKVKTAIKVTFSTHPARNILVESRRSEGQNERHETGESHDPVRGKREV
jgi:hypothetical protein